MDTSLRKNSYGSTASSSRSAETSPLLVVSTEVKDPHPSDRRFEDALVGVGVGFFHVVLVFVAGWALASDSVEVQCISFVTPQLTEDPDVSPSSVREGRELGGRV